MTESGGTIRVTSWNIRGAVGADGRCDPGRVLASIRHMAPDILALQEVDGRAQFGRIEEAFEIFSRELGAHLVEARTVLRPRRDYGHLLWSRWPIERQAVRRLPGGRIEPRMAIDAVLSTPSGPLRVLSAHLGLFGRDRRAQAAALAAWAREEPGPTIVLGDLNEWRGAGPVDALLGRVLPVRLAPRSWPSRRPFARMDRFYGSTGIEMRLEDADVASRGQSDHIALTAELRLPPDPRSGFR